MTYSLSLTGAPSGYLPTPAKVLTVDDSVGRKLDSTLNGQNLAMSDGTQFLCQKSDGSQAWYTFDAERSTPGNLVLRAVGP